MTPPTPTTPASETPICAAMPVYYHRPPFSGVCELVVCVPLKEAQKLERKLTLANAEKEKEKEEIDFHEENAAHSTALAFKRLAVCKDLRRQLYAITRERDTVLAMQRITEHAQNTEVATLKSKLANLSSVATEQEEALVASLTRIAELEAQVISESKWKMTKRQIVTSIAWDIADMDEPIPMAAFLVRCTTQQEAQAAWDSLSPEVKSRIESSNPS